MKSVDVPGENMIERLNVVVKTNCSKGEVVGLVDGVFRVNLKSLPEKGRANAELEKLLSKQFKKNAKVVFGLKSKRKVVKIW